MTQARSGMRGKLIVVALIAVIAAVAVGLASFFLGRQTAPAANVAFISHGPTIEKLQELGSLVTLRVHVADVLEGKDASWWGDVRGVWLIKGDALLGVDMRKAKIVSRDEVKRTATVKLPPPEILSPRVDHERTKTYEVRTGILRSADVADALRDQAMLEAQRLVEQTARQADNVKLSRDLVQRMLTKFFEEFDWKLEIQWEG